MSSLKECIQANLTPLIEECNIFHDSQSFPSFESIISSLEVILSFCRSNSMNHEVCGLSVQDTKYIASIFEVIWWGYLRKSVENLCGYLYPDDFIGSFAISQNILRSMYEMACPLSLNNILALSTFLFSFLENEIVGIYVFDRNLPRLLHGIIVCHTLLSKTKEISVENSSLYFHFNQLFERLKFCTFRGSVIRALRHFPDFDSDIKFAASRALNDILVSSGGFFDTICSTLKGNGIRYLFF